MQIVEEGEQNPEDPGKLLNSSKIVVFWQVDKEKVTSEDLK